MITAVINFPSRWPPLEDSNLVTHAVPSTHYYLELKAKQSGNFEIWLIAGEKRNRLLDSVSVEVQGKWAVVMQVWSGRNVKLIIEMTDIPPNHEGSEPIKLELSEEVEGTGEISLNSPTADDICRQWMTWRRDNLANLEVPPGRVPKTLRDQVQELQFALQRVQELLRVIEQGNLYWLGSLAVELRSLLHWKEHEFQEQKRRKYIQVPLLFRVAQYKNLALPIFMRGSQPEALRSVTGLLFQTSLNAFSVRHKPPNLHLADLQEWLSSPAFYDSELKPTSMKEMIAGHAETMGPGHYDSGIPSVIDTLNRFKTYDTAVATNFLFMTAQGVIEVGEYVLGYFSSELG